MLCIDCNDTGVYEQDGSSMTCPFCASKQKLMRGLKSSIRRAKKQRNRKLHKSLVTVKNFLPHYPVMAAMEAEANKLDDNFVRFIKKAFCVLEMH